MNIFVCFSPFRCHDDPEAVSDSQVRTRRRAQAGGKVCQVDARGQQSSKVRRLGKVRIDIPIQSWKLLLYLRQESFPRIVIFLLCVWGVLHFLSRNLYFLTQVLRRDPRCRASSPRPEDSRNPDPVPAPLRTHPREAFGDELRHGRGGSRAKVRQPNHKIRLFD